MKRCKLDCAISSGVGCHTNCPPNRNSPTERLCAFFIVGQPPSVAEISRRGICPIISRVADAPFIATLQLHIKMTTTLAHQLAEYACALRYEDLSSAVVHEVKRRVIDSFGCA